MQPLKDGSNVSDSWYVQMGTHISHVSTPQHKISFVTYKIANKDLLKV